MLRRVVPALLVSVLLAGCGGRSTPDQDAKVNPTPVGGRVTTADEKASFEMPEGWVKSDLKLDGVVVFAANKAGDDVEQVFVSSFAKIDDAEAGAIYAATTLSAQGAKCTRIRRDTTFGTTQRVVDCLFDGVEPVHKIMVAMGDADHGAMLLVQGRGETQADLKPLVAPLVASWKWLD
jgi:hypothetical protein